MSAPRELFDLLLADDTADDSVSFIFIDAQSNERIYSRRQLRTAVLELSEQLDNGSGLAAVLTTSQEQQVLHYLALLAAGYTPALLTPPNRKLDPAWYFKSMVGVLSTIAPTVVITDIADEILRANAAGAPLPTIRGLDDLGVIAQGSLEPVALDASTAFVQFSSGTTGVKKGVAVSYTAIAAQLKIYAAAIGITPDDVVVNWLPLYHDMGFITSLHLPLYTRVPSVMLHPLDWVARPASFFQAVSKHRGTLSWQPNFALAFMASRIKDAELDGMSLTSLRSMVNCSEPVTFAAQEQFGERFGSAGLSASVFTGCYAMAETTYGVTHGTNTQANAVDDEGPRNAPALKARLPLVSVGSPLPDVEMRVIREDGADAEDGELGEVLIRAPFLADGYVNNTDATATAFVDGWYHSGDLGYRRDNRYWITGRKKDVLIVAGNNVFPEDIERIVGETPGVRGGRVVAFSVFDDRLQTERVVVLVEQEDESITSDFGPARQQIMSELQLANFVIETVPAGWLIKSSAGKPSRSGSREKWLADH